MEKRGPIYVLICYLCWGLFPLYWKPLGVVNSFYVLCARVVLSLVFIAAVLLVIPGGYRRVRAVAANKRELLQLAASGVCMCVNWGIYIWAVGHGYTLDSSLAYYMNPILSILLGTVVFREKLTWLQWLAVGVTLAGLAVTVARFGKFPWVALLIGGSFAIYSAVKKGVTADSATAVFYETLVLTPFCLAAVLLMDFCGIGAVGVIQEGWLWAMLLGCGVVTTIPLLFFGAGIRYTPMTMVGILMYVNPTIQFLVSVLVLGEAFTSTYKILFAFVWTGLAIYLLASWLQHRKSSKEEQICG